MRRAATLPTYAPTLNGPKDARQLWIRGVAHPEINVFARSEARWIALLVIPRRRLQLRFGAERRHRRRAASYACGYFDLHTDVSVARLAGRGANACRSRMRNARCACCVQCPLASTSMRSASACWDFPPADIWPPTSPRLSMNTATPPSTMPTPNRHVRTMPRWSIRSRVSSAASATTARATTCWESGRKPRDCTALAGRACAHRHPALLLRARARRQHGASRREPRDARCLPARERALRGTFV